MATNNGGTLYVLQARPPAIIALSPDGSHEVVIANLTRTPDGIKVDAENQVVYWTNMGIPNLDDGSIERSDLDGKNRKVIVPVGKTHTPKQIILEKKSGKLYWCDREGMRVMRCNLDGSSIETIVVSGRGEVDSRLEHQLRLAVEAELGALHHDCRGVDASTSLTSAHRPRALSAPGPLGVQRGPTGRSGPGAGRPP